MSYDSRPDTWAHIHTVQGYMHTIAEELHWRGWEHDQSKLESPEVEIFNEFTPKLRDSTYGSDEYKGFLGAMGEGLRHHYDANAHHPENHRNGVEDMTLVDVIEMLCDWKAATKRHADGDLERSIYQNRERFGYGEEFTRLLVNTATAMGWIDADVSVVAIRAAQPSVAPEREREPGA